MLMKRKENRIQDSGFRIQEMNQCQYGCQLLDSRVSTLDFQN